MKYSAVLLVLTASAVDCSAITSCERCIAQPSCSYCGTTLSLLSGFQPGCMEESLISQACEAAVGSSILPTCNSTRMVVLGGLAVLTSLLL